MQCERAQEFFSDYLERTLDRPMTVALESHLGTCARCRDEVEAIQEMMLALDAVPEVEPPWDGAWQVMSRMRSARAEQLEAQRPRTPTFFQWLRSLSPVSVAMGAGLATLVIAGTLLLPIVSDHVLQSGPPPIRLQPATVNLPVVQATYHPERQEIELLVTPLSDLPTAQVHLEEVGGPTHDLSDGWGLSPQRPLKQSVFVQNSDREAEAMWMQVSCPKQGKEYRYLIVVPLKQRTEERVTLLAENQPVEEALRQLAPYLGRPVVVSGAGQTNVRLNVAGDTPQHCLDEIAQQVRTRVTTAADGYHLAPLQ